MALIYKTQVHKKGHATCSKCGKFLSKKDLKKWRYCPHINQYTKELCNAKL